MKLQNDDRILLRIWGQHYGFFCAGAVFEFDPPICVAAADKIQSICLHRGLNKVIALCRLKGWQHEIVAMEASR